MADNETLQAEIDALRQQVALLQEREVFYRDFVENIDDCVVQVGPQGTIRYINQAVERLTGYTVEEMMGANLFDWLHTEDREVSQQIITGWRENHVQTDRYENRLLSKQGETVYVLWSASMRYDDDGNLLFVKAVGCDITDRRRLEEEVQRANDELEERIAKQTIALDHQQALLLGVIDNLPVSLTVRDMEGLFLLINRHFSQILSVDRDQLIGKYDHELFPEEVEAWRTSDQQLRQTGKPIELEESYDLPDGKHTFISAKFPIYDNDGSIYAVGVITTDITDRKKAEDELRNFKALAEYAPDIIVVSTMDGIITYVNPAHHREIGYEESSLGMSIADFYPPESQERLPEILHTIQTAGIWQGELLHMREDGSSFMALTSGFLIRDDQGNPQAMAALVRDISDLQEAQQQKEELQQRIIATQQATLRELSTPLIPIADHVVLMPLVGSIDSKRAQDIMEMLLEGIGQYQADIAIVDITGVPVIDTQVANALIQVAKAVHLLGSKVVLTGIGPTMAQTLVHLGADLSMIITRGSLQSAVQWALST